jgi:SAM-dependent methyltransferase
MAETRKAHARRIASGFYEKYIHGKGIDIGCGRIDTYDGLDTISPTAFHHDKDDCDATFMDIFPDDQFDYVYASHVLEHISDPVTAVKNWLRICKPGGVVIISVPHRDLYERKRTLPSRWNEDHKYFYLPQECDPPHTFSLAGVVNHACKGVQRTIESFEVIDSATNADRPEEHNDGEFSIELIIRK